MSATLQGDWVTNSPEASALRSSLCETRIMPAERSGPLWDTQSVSKSLMVQQLKDPREIALRVMQAHIEGGSGSRGPTICVVNRVETAMKVSDELTKIAQRAGTTDIRLIHSRFRPAEREVWRSEFLNREACRPGTDRIIVSTQVIEAGVDLSAAVLITEIAPWPSLVQRFGRSARWGGTAEVIIIDSGPKDAAGAAPYSKDEIDAARVALAELNDVSPRSLEQFEDANPHRIASLYPYRPSHLLMERDLHDLFDTSPDLSGADVDVSRFIRSGEDRDVQVFWRPIDRNVAPPSELRADQNELCAVPFLHARKWLFGKGGTRLAKGRRAWVWDWIEGQWQPAESRLVFPGQVILVSSESGGYGLQRGWDPRLGDPVERTQSPDPDGGLLDADSLEEDESLSAAANWQTIGFHGHQVGKHALDLAATLAPQMATVLEIAGRWHDAGKVHPAFQASLSPHGFGLEIAKAPASFWKRGRQLYRLSDGTRRPGFRHELASTLALLGLLATARPNHPALLGQWSDLLSVLPRRSTQISSDSDSEAPMSQLLLELAALDPDSYDLILYLVCSHHGKVRMVWHPSPADQDSTDLVPRIRGIQDGDVLPELQISDQDGNLHHIGPVTLSLAAAGAGLNSEVGRGWTERVLGLLDRYGPLTLAWLEALLRAADQRASRDDSLTDPWLSDASATERSPSARDQGSHGFPMREATP